MRGTGPLWRWRANPLKRRDDVLEAWLVLAVWAVIVLGGAVVGTLTARATGDVLARQRDERRPTSAVLVADAPRADARTSGQGEPVPTVVRWHAPDGSRRLGRTPVAPGTRAGARVKVWLDAAGRPVAEPPTRAEAALQAALFATGAGLGLAGLAVGAGALARGRLDRRRVAAWGHEWDSVEPRWSHRMR
ncbi:hypothetical protein AB0E88_30620 [Streptomyces sp. NPDC028635]|uniref:Rv1733c family protein n=1 Tax=Streptomyces sp. NPDC028635 TaxID=3154800 RepID=UPI0033F2D5FA